mmetsp:Transcript_2098/g.2417  ORF Transcript_2098/g.2417 Transcript_2098/m.2417 type:complete len:208 (+) Transcript_2098:191-814(+)
MIVDGDIQNLVKCVVVGDSAVGKTCMVVSYALNKFPEEYIPTIFDSYESEIVFESLGSYTFQIIDTAGSEQFDGLRENLCYDTSNLFIVCYSLTDADSFENISSKWVPSIRQRVGKQAPIVLVGNKLDMQDNFFKYKGNNNNSLLYHKELLHTQQKKLKAQYSVLVSAKTRENLQETFNKAIRIAVERKITYQENQKRNNKSGCILF